MIRKGSGFHLGLGRWHVQCDWYRWRGSTALRFCWALIRRWVRLPRPGPQWLSTPCLFTLPRVLCTVLLCVLLQPLRYQGREAAAAVERRRRAWRLLACGACLLAAPACLRSLPACGAVLRQLLAYLLAKIAAVERIPPAGLCADRTLT